MCLCEKGGCVLQLLMLLRFQNYIFLETSAKLINFRPHLTPSEVILELSSKWDGCIVRAADIMLVLAALRLQDRRIDIRPKY